MIDITSEMIGPADPMALIEEEYADALLRVRFLLEAFRAHDPSNNTAHGRMVYQLRWLERELAARRVPIPLDRRWILRWTSQVQAHYWGFVGSRLDISSLSVNNYRRTFGLLHKHSRRSR